MINYVDEDGTIFGTTSCLAMGQRRPELIFGKQAQKLRETNNLTVLELSKELSIKAELIENIEAQKKGMTEAVMAKYMKKFNVEKEYFFDTDLNVYIVNEKGNILKRFNSSKECKDAFNFLKKEFEEGNKEGTKNFSMFIDFSKEVK